MNKPLTTEEFNAIKERAYYGSRALLDFELIQTSQADVLPLIAEVDRLNALIFAERKEHLLNIFETLGKADARLVEENKTLRDALKEIAYTPKFKEMYEIEAFATRVLEGEKP